MSSNDSEFNVCFLPFMAPGHMTPMVDIARLFASQGNVKATIIATPANASRFHNTISRDNKSGSKITFRTIPLPLEEVGLPQGCENLVAASTREKTFKLFRAIEILQPKLETLLMEINPNCIVSDTLYPWTVDISQKLGIPRLSFSGSSFFSNCLRYDLETYRPHENVTSENEEFFVSNLPDKITLTRSQLQDIVKGETNFNALFERLKNADKKSFGIIMNSFYDLEHAYADFFKVEMGYKSWHIGPLSMFNTLTLDDKVERGDTSSINVHSCLNWLDSKESRSVIYICFGSLTRFTKPQLVEIARALEESRHPFIWVLGRVIQCEEFSSQIQDEDEWWLPDNFEESNKKNEQGLIIRGWAPQVLILEHKAIGGFVTHCGWNSILEGICAGVPLITWPMFAEQFYNEKLVTQVLKIGVSVGNMVWKAWAMEESELIEKQKIRKAISIILNEGEEIRKRTKEFSLLARKAIEEGGSSYNNIKILIEEIKQYKRS